MKKSTKDKRAGKAGKPAKKDYELTYFLDHPQIKRHPCVGNQDPKPSLGAQIGFPGMGGTTVKPKESQPASSSSAPKTASSDNSIMKQINWGGKFNK